jgi:hypothetical protein
VALPSSGLWKSWSGEVGRLPDLKKFSAATSPQSDLLELKEYCALAL